MGFPVMPKLIIMEANLIVLKVQRNNSAGHYQNMKKVLLGDSVFMIELVLIPVFGIIEQKPENRGMSYNT